ncbi:MAG: electron transport complex subunit RsxC [Oscillospiraceae bacterium]|nr:electron transport complex subunit RsxC [Oscillospiraceae bacterium]
MKHPFFGGIHPKYNKEMSTGVTSFQSIVPKQVIIPMQQHIGAPCQPLVQVGDTVLRGQKIGDSDGLCVPVHASVSGKVIAVEPRPHTSGRQVVSVVIENDFQDTTVVPAADASQMDDDTILHRIREAGIVGMGGAAFPGNAKALSALGKADTLIANACECEPYITADDSLLRTTPEQVLSGMQIMRKILRPERTVLAVEDNKQKAISKLKPLMGSYPEIELKILPTRYPQGSEKQLIQSVTGRQVLSGNLPVSVGCAVFNVATFAAIHRAVCLGIPLTERIVTISGEAIQKPQNFIVRIGTPFHDLIEAAGGLTDATERVVSGGPMMGFAQSDLSVPVIKATNSILCLLKDRNGASENPVCLRCGKCVGVCPMGLQPLYLYRYSTCSDAKQLERLHLLDCMECGSCAYTCPGKLPLVEQFRKGKAFLRAEQANRNNKEATK